MAQMTIAQFRAKLRRIRAKVENKTKAGLILSGDLVAQRAADRAPRHTGRLVRSITRSNPRRAGQTAWEIDVGSNLDYARDQETQQPYLRPALEESKRDVERILADSVGSALRG